MTSLSSLASRIGIPIPAASGKSAAATQPSHVPFNPKAMTAIRVVAALVLGGVVIVAFAAPMNWSIAVLISLAITGVGTILGFLFGIPRTSGGDGVANVDSTPSGGATASARASTRPRNASLEQVADWLTKLMLGAGLTQLSDIKHGILRLAETIATCVTPTGSTLGSAAGVFGLGVIGFFSACGFLGGYLSTRLLLARLLIEEEQNMDDLQAAKAIAREEGRKQGETEAFDKSLLEVNRQSIESQAMNSFIGTDAASQAIAKSAENWNPTIAPSVVDDPQKGRFGGKSEVGGRKMSATVKPLTEEEGELFCISVRVESTDPEKKLTQPVKFFFHQTFDPDTAIVAPKNGVVTLNITAWGAFTLGAMTDDGNTLLELDLSGIPDAPKKFASR